MNGLMLHCGAHEVSRDKVFEAVTPEPSGAEGKEPTHFPIPHSLLLTEVEKNLERNGFEIVNQAHALTNEDLRYFGLLEVRKTGVKGVDSALEGMAHLDSPDVKPDYGLVIGLRNTHDMSWAAALCMGNRVFVCDNLAFSGEVLIGRRHTKNIRKDIPNLIPRAFGALGHERVSMEKRIEAYKNSRLTDEAASHLIINSIVDERIFPASNLKRIVEEWREPSHDAFKDRTVWSLVNAYTEVAKPSVTVKVEKDEETGEEAERQVIRGGNPQTLMTRTRNLHGFFDKAIGLNLPTRDEILKQGLEDGAVVGHDVLRRNN